MLFLNYFYYLKKNLIISYLLEKRNYMFTISSKYYEKNDLIFITNIKYFNYNDFYYIEKKLFNEFNIVIYRIFK